jgi:hypothetical protein
MSWQDVPHAGMDDLVDAFDGKWNAASVPAWALTGPAAPPTDGLDDLPDGVPPPPSRRGLGRLTRAVLFVLSGGGIAWGAWRAPLLFPLEGDERARLLFLCVVVLFVLSGLLRVLAYRALRA